MDLERILDALRDYGLPAGLPTIVVIAAVAFYIRNPSALERHAARLLSLLGRLLRFILRHLKWSSGYFRRRSMATDIETYVNSAMRTLRHEAPMLDPYGVKVEFIRPGRSQSTRIEEEGQVVLVLHPDKPEVNLANAVWRFSQLGAIRDGAEYLDSPVKLSTDLNVARRVLFGRDRAKRAAYYHFKDHVLADCLSSSEEVAEWYDKLRAIDGNGFFSRVYLNEVAELCESLANSGVSHESIPREVRKFIDFLFAIHTRKKGEKSRLQFAEPWIGVQIVLVGEGKKLAREEIWRYLDAIESGITSGDVKSVYVAAFSDPNTKLRYPRTDPIAIAQRVADAAEKRWKSVRRAVAGDVLYRGVVRDERKVIICIPLRVMQL